MNLVFCVQSDSTHIRETVGCLHLELRKRGAGWRWERQRCCKWVPSPQGSTTSSPCTSPTPQSWQTLSATSCFTLLAAGMASRAQMPQRLHFILGAARAPKGKGEWTLVWLEKLEEQNPAPQIDVLKAILGVWAGSLGTPGEEATG